MAARRVLVTGVASYWGGKLAQRLEAFDDVAAIVGVDTADPTSELDRTEFVRVGAEHALIQRIVEAAEIDTVIDTRLIVDSLLASRRHAHEVNVIGTDNIIAACAGPASPVRRLVLKSSAHVYGCAQDDPAFFTEDHARRSPPSNPIERDIVEAEATVAEFAEGHPGVHVTVLRCANVLGTSVQTSHVKLLSLPAVPTIFGFDPRYQFVHEDDVVEALVHVAQDDLPGDFNVAGDGVLALTEVISLLGKYPAPILPPWLTVMAVAPMRAAGLPVSEEMLGQLRFGRGLDNRRLKATGFETRTRPRTPCAPSESGSTWGISLRASPTVTRAMWRISCTGARTWSGSPIQVIRTCPVDASLGVSTQTVLRIAHTPSAPRAGLVESDAEKPWNPV